MTGRFVTLEGGEGSGKSTQILRLREALEARGRAVVVTREPGGTALGGRLRALLVERSEDPPGGLTELLLYAADRAHHVATVVKPALVRGSVVLCDRFADATEAYQGWGRGLDLSVVADLNRLATGGLAPDRTVVLDLDPAEGIHRSLARVGAELGPAEVRFEEEDLAFHRRVLEGYRAIAERDPGRVRWVDASGSPGQVYERVWGEVADLFGLPALRRDPTSDLGDVTK